MDCSRNKAQRRASAAVEDGPARSAAQFEDDGAPFRSREASTTAVFLQLLPRIASSVPRNQVACVLRLLCKAAAATLRGPQHATVHLSEPVPPAEFKWRWCGPHSLRRTNLQQRRLLETLTARSGVVANLEALAARGDTPTLCCPSSSWFPLLDAAAGAGRLGACRLLHEQRGVPLYPGALRAAAAGGHTDVCEWLLHAGCKCSISDARRALENGHARLAERLLQLQSSRYEAWWSLESVAYGCDLATLQRLHAEYGAGHGPLTSDAEYYLPQELNAHLCGSGAGPAMLCAAARSPTPDWAAKVEWLEGLGCPRTPHACAAAARCCADGAARVAWLHDRGYPLVPGVAIANAATEAGNVEALRYVLAQGVTLQQHADLWLCLHFAFGSGSLEAVQMLWEAGGMADMEGLADALSTHYTQQTRAQSMFSHALERAACEGHLHILSWVAEQLGDRAVLDGVTFASAARSGSLPLLRWLREHGCPWDATAFTAAAGAGSEEALEWLVEHGCPMGADGEAYVEATGNCDLPTLRCLAQLGCPFAPDGFTFTGAAEALLSLCTLGWLSFHPPLLLWLLNAGCPVDWDAVVQACRKKGSDGAAACKWLEGQRKHRA